jgi:hypothetical protein
MTSFGESRLACHIALERAYTNGWYRLQYTLALLSPLALLPHNSRHLPYIHPFITSHKLALLCPLALTSHLPHDQNVHYNHIYTSHTNNIAMVKLPTASNEVVQTSLQYHSEVHVRSAVDECEKNRPTSLLVELLFTA